MSEPEDDVEALADRMMEAPPEVRIDFLLRALGDATDKLDVVTRIAKGRNDQLDRAHELITELQTERDRLRAVVDAARAYLEAEVDDSCPDPEYQREGLVAALAELDVSGDMGGDERDRLREMLTNTATDVRVLAKAIAHGNALAVAALVEQIEARLVSFEVGEAAPCVCGHEYDCHTSGVAVGCDAMEDADVCPCTAYRVPGDLLQDPELHAALLEEGERRQHRLAMVDRATEDLAAAKGEGWMAWSAEHGEEDGTEDAG